MPNNRQKQKDLQNQNVEFMVISSEELRKANTKDLDTLQKEKDIPRWLLKPT